MTATILTTDQQLEELCQHLRTVDAVAFDTEFVSEHTYRPVLCLVQIATREQVVAVDPLAVRDMTPLWKVLSEGPHETVVHAGREELQFCLEATGKRLARLFDVQLAAAFVGVEYPAGYGTLTQRLLEASAQKGETRTDWRKRPLSKAQVTYALDDVRYLLPLRDELYARLDRLKRREWLHEEMLTWQNEIEEGRTRERWRNVSGSGSLFGRPLAILRELWRWRETEAQQRNCPPRRVLRDDLLVELAKRQVTDPQQVCALRGMERSALRQAVPDLVECIQRGIAAPETNGPRPVRPVTPPQITMLGQFLSAALSSICQEAQLASSLVGNPTDVRDLISYRLSGAERSGLPAPKLTLGWRAEVVGRMLEDLLVGDMTIRIRDPRSDQPLSFEPRVKAEQTDGAKQAAQ